MTCNQLKNIFDMAEDALVNRRGRYVKPGKVLVFLDMQLMYAISNGVSFFCLVEDITTFTAFGEPVCIKLLYPTG